MKQSLLLPEILLTDWFLLWQLYLNSVFFNLTLKELPHGFEVIGYVCHLWKSNMDLNKLLVCGRKGFKLHYNITVSRNSLVTMHLLQNHRCWINSHCDIRWRCRERRKRCCWNQKHACTGIHDHRPRHCGTIFGYWDRARPKWQTNSLTPTCLYSTTTWKFRNGKLLSIGKSHPCFETSN